MLRKLTFLAALVFGMASAQAETRTQAASLRALVDRPLLSLADDDFGVVKAIAVDVETGAAPWMLVLSGRNLVPVPTEAVAFDTLGVLRLHMSDADFMQAPRWKTSQLPEINRPEAVQRIAYYYHMKLGGSPLAAAAAGEGSPYRILGTRIPGAPGEDFSDRARIIGDRLVSIKSGDLGGIVDLLVELPAATASQVALEREGGRLAVPFRRMIWQPNSKIYATKMSEVDLRRLAKAEWPDDMPVTVIRK